VPRVTQEHVDRDDDMKEDRLALEASCLFFHVNIFPQLKKTPKSLIQRSSLF